MPALWVTRTQLLKVFNCAYTTMFIAGVGVNASLNVYLCVGLSLFGCVHLCAKACSHLISCVIGGPKRMHWRHTCEVFVIVG